MCTRYYIDAESDVLLPYMQAAGRSSLARTFLELGTPILTSGEVRPCDVAPVLATSKRRTKAVFPMKWGYTMTGASGERASLLLNARSETAGTKPTFAESWREHRCIIPCSWYYEWEHFTSPSGTKKTGAKYLIQPKGSQITCLCGLYRMEQGLPCFVVLTREPSQSVAHIHDRMPLMLPEHLAEDWVDPANEPEAFLPHALTEMVTEQADA
jgi:putative SOS response-associated peptidase YedK